MAVFKHFDHIGIVVCDLKKAWMNWHTFLVLSAGNRWKLRRPEFRLLFILWEQARWN